jgi:8-oxo-dGTP pyrophosphatase MutT (NUDIX family)
MNQDNVTPDRAAVIPFRWQAGELQILLITSRRDGRWIIPKGRLEAGMSPAESAAKEAIEEAGVAGILVRDSLGTYLHPVDARFVTVQVFCLLVNDVRNHWLEESQRKRAWFTLQEALQRLDLPGLRQIVLRWAAGVSTAASSTTRDSSDRRLGLVALPK